MKCFRSVLRVAWPAQLRPFITQIPARFKYTQHQGVKGIRNRKSFYEAQMQAGLQEKSDPTAVSSGDMRFLDDRWV